MSTAESRDRLINYIYPDFVDKAAACDDKDRLVLAAMGLCGEAGEVSELIKKHQFHGKPLDHDKLVLEMGDVFWYFTLLCVQMGIPLTSIIHANIDKLRARHGDQHGRVTAESTTFARTQQGETK